MGADKKTTRVMLQFNCDDFRHNKVVSVLRSRPRNMTELVVNAVLHYISCPEVGQEINKDSVRKIVREVLVEMFSDGSLNMSLTAGGRHSSITEEDTNNIGSMMNAFR